MYVCIYVCMFVCMYICSEPSVKLTTNTRTCNTDSTLSVFSEPHLPKRKAYKDVFQSTPSLYESRTLGDKPEEVHVSFV